ncbi:Zinc finger protein RTS2 [Bienertia sinuspersici]
MGGPKYERLGDFCNYCGKLGHVDRDYEDMVNKEEKMEMAYRYGPWTRASPLKRGIISKEENEKERLMMDKLKKKKWGYGAREKEAIITMLGPLSLARITLFKEGKERDKHTRRIVMVFIMMREGPKFEQMI